MSEEYCPLDHKGPQMAGNLELLICNPEHWWPLQEAGARELQVRYAKILYRGDRKIAKFCEEAWATRSFREVNADFFLKKNPVQHKDIRLMSTRIQISRVKRILPPYFQKALWYLPQANGLHWREVRWQPNHPVLFWTSIRFCYTVLFSCQLIDQLQMA